LVLAEVITVDKQHWINRRWVMAAENASPAFTTSTGSYTQGINEGVQTSERKNSQCRHQSDVEAQQGNEWYW
jgi:hypothetical protein